jgi:membrane dipeptidase
VPCAWAGTTAPGRSAGQFLSIDGLSIAFNVMDDEALEPELIDSIRNSGLSAINMTTPHPGDDFRAAVDKISRLQHIVSVHAGDLQIIRSVADINDCQLSGRMGIIIGFQSTEMFDESLDAIAIFRGLGARIMQMSYNGPGIFGHGCLSENDDGLTPTGKRAVARLNEKGILIDASHANKATTAETIALCGEPLVISHTGCNAIYAHPRNNDDTELRALAEKGGVAGIYLMPFLDGGTDELTVEMLFLHLEHALNVCGEEHVGIGSDQGVRAVDDGPEYRERLRAEVEQRKAAGISAPGESADRPPFIPALNRSDRLLEIARLMSSRGHSGRVIEKVIGKNFYRVMSEVW